MPCLPREPAGDLTSMCSTPPGAIRVSLRAERAERQVEHAVQVGSVLSLAWLLPPGGLRVCSSGEALAGPGATEVDNDVTDI